MSTTRLRRMSAGTRKRDLVPQIRIERTTRHLGKQSDWLGKVLKNLATRDCQSVPGNERYFQPHGLYRDSKKGVGLLFRCGLLSGAFPQVCRKGQVF